MGRISADNLLFDFAIFLAMAVPFGIATGATNVQASLNTIFGPWPTFQQLFSQLSGPAHSCGSLDFGCQASAGIAQATAFAGAVIGYPGGLFLSLLSRISAFGNLGVQLTFGPTASLQSIPGAGLVVVGLIVIIAFELFRMFRGSSVGA